MLDFMAPIVMRSARFRALSSKIDQKVVFGSYCLCWWALFSVGSNCFLVACIEYLFISTQCFLNQINHYRQLLSSLPLWWIMCRFHLSLSSNDIRTMIVSLHICGSVQNDQLWLYIFRSFHIAELSTCGNISFVTRSGLGDCFFILADCCFDISSCHTPFHVIRCHFLNLPLSLFLSYLLTYS